MINPLFFRHERLTELSPYCRLLFIALWTLADREGRLEDRPKRIKADAFPYEHDLDVEQMLSDLASNGFITRYEVDGESYIEIPSFLKHQKPHLREAASVIPAPITAKANLRQAQGEPKAGPENAEDEPFHSQGDRSRSRSRSRSRNTESVSESVAKQSPSNLEASPQADASPSLALVDTHTLEPEDPIPIAIREMRDTILSCLPVNFRYDSASMGEAQQLAQDFAGNPSLITDAIAAIRSRGERVWPNAIRKHIQPSKPKPVGPTLPPVDMRYAPEWMKEKSK